MLQITERNIQLPRDAIFINIIELNPFIIFFAFIAFVVQPLLSFSLSGTFFSPIQIYHTKVMRELKLLKLTAILFHRTLKAVFENRRNNS